MNKVCIGIIIDWLMCTQTGVGWEVVVQVHSVVTLTLLIDFTPLYKLGDVFFSLLGSFATGECIFSALQTL